MFISPLKCKICVYTLLYMWHIFTFVSDKCTPFGPFNIFFYWESASMYLFLDQIKVAVICCVHCCCVIWIWNDRSTCSTQRRNIQYCVSIFCYLLFPRREVYHGKPFVRRLKGWFSGRTCERVRACARDFSLWGFPRPRCTQIHTNCMVAPCSMPCLFNYFLPYCDVLLPHPLFSINVLFRLTRKCCFIPSCHL